MFSDLISSVVCVFCLLYNPGHLVCFKSMHPPVRKEWLPLFGGTELYYNLLKHRETACYFPCHACKMQILGLCSLKEHHFFCSLSHMKTSHHKNGTIWGQVLMIYYCFPDPVGYCYKQG